MISILIPVYNYNISKLATTLHKEAISLDIDFEIICFDDHSERFTTENKTTLESLKHSKYIYANSNVGRTAARQQLSDNATFDWLLFLDADVIPKSSAFIKNYLDEIPNNYDAVFGGFAYEDQKPEGDSVLRWTYGKNFEQVDAKKRNLNPYQVIISANFMIKKSIFNQVYKQIDIKTYGTDNYIASLLKEENAKVYHINNEVFHLGLESNTIYFNKIKASVLALIWLQKQHKMDNHENKLLSTFVSLKKFKLNYLLSLCFKLFGTSMEKNMLSDRPNMMLLQLYKLTFICYKDLNG
ncbi:glycosyltransferase family 2 protein [Tamlana haliotis]|uniref:Glycosyltransferase family 2 protein n=1 Tax=Pseudotamlana haliotis TaxID=2614804 RepID=A0A6N6MEN5_9FLAO|nr:glycosyltransferase [Tamlana haliotis]KAB1068220.1 glycosyltransferase family 2 protein [Tamlana haliotis]